MAKTVRISATIVCLHFICFSYAFGHENSGEFAILQKQLESLHSELSIARKDMRALRLEVIEIHKILRTGKATVASPTKPAAVRPTPRPTRNSDTTIYEVPIGSSPFLGPKDAPVTIVEFTDLQCPFCVREFPKIQQILEEYPDQVRFVFKHYPLNTHKKAPAAHAAVELALQERGPDAFWFMHDMIFDNPKKLEFADLRGYAKELELNLGYFDEVLADPIKINKLFSADMALARKCNVYGTPTVLINGLKLTNRNLDDYRARIDQILGRTKRTNIQELRSDMKKLLEPPKLDDTNKNPDFQNVLAVQTVEVGCSNCIFKMSGVRGCKLAAKINGTPLLVNGANVNAHGAGLCKTKKQAIVSGKIESGLFVASRFDIQL